MYPLCVVVDGRQLLEEVEQPNRRILERVHKGEI
jgi:hypothetical protein